MDTKLYQFGYQKSIKGNNLVAALATTPAVDRDGDVVEPLGVDLANFKNNPVLLWSHDYYSLPIGKITDVRASPYGIEFDAEFAVQANPFAKQVRDLFADGVLNAFSIGFMPTERMGDRITHCELLEISAVNVPANPEALNNRSYKSFLKGLESQDKQVLKQWHDEQLQAMDELLKGFQALNTNLAGIAQTVTEIKTVSGALHKRVDTHLSKQEQKEQAQKAKQVQRELQHSFQAQVSKGVLSNLHTH